MGALRPNITQIFPVCGIYSPTFTSLPPDTNSATQKLSLSLSALIFLCYDDQRGESLGCSTAFVFVCKFGNPSHGFHCNPIFQILANELSNLISNFSEQEEDVPLFMTKGMSLSFY